MHYRAPRRLLRCLCGEEKEIMIYKKREAAWLPVLVCRKNIFTAKTDKSIFSYSLLLREKGDRDSGG